MGWISSAWHSTTSGISKAAHVVASAAAPITAGANALAHVAQATAHKVETAVVKVEKAGESVVDHLLTDARIAENALRQTVTGGGNLAEGLGAGAKGLGTGLGDTFSQLSTYLPWILGAAVLGSVAYAANQAGMFKKGKRASA